MTQSALLPSNDGAIVVLDNDTPMFYVVSKRKLTILYLATLGLYGVYWFYKNWDRYKDKWPYASEEGSKVWPVPRAIFSVFFVHSLFREIKAYGHDKPRVAAWANNSDASLFVAMLVVSNMLDRASYKSLGSPYTDILSLAILAPLLVQFLKAQELINLSCGDPEGAGNSRLSKANRAWIAVGGIFWFLIIIGFFVPD